MNRIGKNVLFRFEAGGSNGLGHAARCLTLSRAFGKIGVKCHAIIWECHDGAYPYLKSNGIDPLHSLGAIGTPEDAKFVEAAAVSTNSRIVVLDPKYPTTCLGQLYSSDKYISVCIEDEAIDTGCDVILNNNSFVVAAAYEKSVAVKILAGRQFNLVAGDWFNLETERGPKATERILVTMGGEDPKNHTLNLLSHLFQVSPLYHFDIVLGPSHPDPNAVERLVETWPHCQIHQSPASLSSIAKFADMVFSAGGTTCLELIAAGKPMAAIAVEPHQQQFVNTLSLSGLVFDIAASDGSILPKKVLSFLVDKELRQVLVAATKDFFPGPGADNVVREILQIEKPFLSRDENTDGHI